ncbi:MAG: histidine ammonia-lyase [Candidatus Marinimicrobia bacterium]|nr:histidine ammonia-lyase [Candidatus Neomarinimicrobiota bacterium]MCF7839731.1 histidine ammonia-lyase [Candidatus Neomarinimicrobiota bacterium]
MLRLDGYSVSLKELIRTVESNAKVELAPESVDRMTVSRQVVDDILKTDKVVYGINTGFGKLANQRISPDDLKQLQRNLIRSHAAGVGPLFSEKIVRYILLLKINSLARGYSGIRPEVVQRMVEFYNRGLLSAISSKGSVGASGDLAPLAELALTLTGEGDFLGPDGSRHPAEEVLEGEGLEPLTLLEKEGLSLINGTQVSTALAVAGYAQAKNLLDSMTLIGAFSTEVMLGADTAFRPEIQEARNQVGQKRAAAMLFRVMQDSGFRHSHNECNRVQDFYSLRCIPQVHGSAYDALDFASGIIEREINSATDNPLTLTETGELVSGGNFHAAPIGHVLDYLAIVMTDLGNMSERRIAAFQDSSQSQVPMFLVQTPGLNSGFMIAHVTAASLASENKILSHPATVDTIPTSANQEDHVSMAPNAGRKLLQIIENAEWICGIEYLCCAQAADFHHELALSPITQNFYQQLRETVPFMEEDGVFHHHIETGTRLIREGVLVDIWERENG